MKKTFITYSTDEKGIIHAHKETRPYIKYSSNLQGDITISRTSLLLLIQNGKEKK